MWRSSLMCLPDTSWGSGSHRLWKRHSVLDALEQALWARRPSGTVHHSDKGSQYVSLAYTQRLKEAGLLVSTGSTGDSYDNAMAESINGLYKAEVIHRKSWKNRAEVELATLTGTVAKLAMRQPFVLFKGLTFQKLCLPGAFRPGDHHNKMLRPGLCVVHASPQYL